jgi:hypothetical protein
MSASHTHGRLDSAEECLEHLSALHSEVRSAISAIATNALEPLEQSLWNQHVLCTGLKRLLESLQDARHDLPMMNAMRSSMAALHSLNKTYAELVRQARSQSDVLHSLGESYRYSQTTRTTDAPRCSLEV